jgi:hypothetical protein
MCVSTILVLVIVAARWLLSRQLVSGQFPMSGGDASADRGRGPGPRPGGSRPGRERRPGDPWTAGANPNPGPRDDNQGLRGTRGTPPDWRGDDRTQRGDRPTWTPKDPRDSRASRNDRPRPSY